MRLMEISWKKKTNKIEIQFLRQIDPYLNSDSLAQSTIKAYEWKSNFLYALEITAENSSATRRVKNGNSKSEKCRNCGNFKRFMVDLTTMATF